MALGLLGVMLFVEYTIPELVRATLHNFQPNAEAMPIIPTLFITIACGAVSGFHATQSPLMARCMNNERESRVVFYGAMISESVIALIWAAIGMAFFHGPESLAAALAEHGNNAAWAVNPIAHTTLGQVGAILALLGVVAAPITSGDTAFRSARLIVADILHIEQRTIYKRLMISLPLFAIGTVLLFVDFDIIWRYFAWTNQAMSVVTLWVIVVPTALSGAQFAFSDGLDEMYHILELALKTQRRQLYSGAAVGQQSTQFNVPLMFKADKMHEKFPRFYPMMTDAFAFIINREQFFDK